MRVGLLQLQGRRFPYMCKAMYQEGGIDIGLHPGSVLSHLLFIITMDVLTENIEKDPPWAMMFADDLVLCAMTRGDVEEHFKTWRVLFERHGLKLSTTWTE